jgi:hypothetical protein
VPAGQGTPHELEESNREKKKEVITHFIRRLFDHEEAKNLAWAYWERDKNGKQIHTQESGSLEEGKGYSLDKVKAFFEAWKPKK